MRIEWTVEASAELDSMLAYIAGQDASAAALVATVEYELGRMHAELAGVDLEKDDGVGLLPEADALHPLGSVRAR